MLFDYNSPNKTKSILDGSVTAGSIILYKKCPIVVSSGKM